MVHVERVDLRAMIQKESGHVDGPGDVQRSLPVAATVVALRRVPLDQRSQPVEHPMPRRGTGVHRRPALDQPGDQGTVAVQHAEASRPPMTPGVDTGTRIQEQLRHRSVAPMNRGEQGGGSERAAGHRLVQARCQLRVLRQHPARLRRVTPLEVGQKNVYHRYFLKEKKPVKHEVTKREKLDLQDGTEGHCLVLHHVIDTKGIFSTRSETRIWLTDAAGRLPVEFRSNFPFGTIPLRLRELLLPPATSAAGR